MGNLAQENLMGAPLNVRLSYSVVYFLIMFRGLGTNNPSSLANEKMAGSLRQVTFF